jgi:uncharacterized protein
MEMELPKKKIKAFEWYVKAAVQGNANAQFNLGAVAKDEMKACEWYLKAADQGNANAQYNLGRMFSNGVGIEKD